MTKIALSDHLIGNLGPSDFFVDDTTQRHPLGTVVRGVDVSGTFGFGEYVYLQSNAAIAANNLCVYNDGHQAVLTPVTANTGRGVVVAKADIASGNYGWFQRSGGMIPVKTAASIAAGTEVGISGATPGSANTSAAGLQLLGATSLRASTATRAPTNVQTKNGSKLLKGNFVGVFVGQAVSGTGIAGGSVVAGFDADDNVLLNNAATATGSVTVTFTNTGYIEIAAPQGLILQGRIT